MRLLGDGEVAGEGRDDLSFGHLAVAVGVERAGGGLRHVLRHTARVLVCLGVPRDVAQAAAGTLDTDGDGKVAEGEVVTAFARYFTVSE